MKPSPQMQRLARLEKRVKHLEAYTKTVGQALRRATATLRKCGTPMLTSQDVEQMFREAAAKIGLPLPLGFLEPRPTMKN